MKIKVIKPLKKSIYNNLFVDKIKQGQGDKDFIKGFGKKITMEELNNLCK